jgi:hypothetical protein
MQWLMTTWKSMQFQKFKMVTKEKVMSKYLELRKINVNEHTEKKGKFTYLSWAWAVDQLLQLDPTATWEYKDPVYFAETLMVFCSVTAFGKTMTAQLPVMNNQNKAILNPDAFAVNTAMQRCLAKAIALHGLGLYIYAGEDIPDEDAPDLTADTDKWVLAISNTKSMDELKEIYSAAYKALSKDKSAVDKLASAKDLQKGTLMALQA